MAIPDINKIDSNLEGIGTISFVHGKRGSIELQYNGYTYRHRKGNGLRTYWSCVQKNCPSTCILFNNETLTEGSHEHNHLGGEQLPELRRQDFKQRIKELVLTLNEKPRGIFDILVNEVEDSTTKAFLKEHQLFFTSYASQLRMKKDHAKKTYRMNKNEDDDLKITFEPRGEIMLMDGFKFSRRGSRGRSSRWICLEPGCEVINYLDDLGNITTQDGIHNHQPPLQKQLQDMDIKYQIWQLARTTSETPDDIIMRVAPNEVNEKTLTRYKRDIVQARLTIESKSEDENTLQENDRNILQPHEENITYNEETDENLNAAEYLEEDSVENNKEIILVPYLDTVEIDETQENIGKTFYMSDL